MNSTSKLVAQLAADNRELRRKLEEAVRERDLYRESLDGGAHMVGPLWDLLDLERKRRQRLEDELNLPALPAALPPVDTYESED